MFQKGVSLYITLVILVAMTTALFALVSLSLSQTKIIWAIGDSVVAFYAADTGVENILYGVYREGYSLVAGDCVHNPPLSLWQPLLAWQPLFAEAEYRVCVSLDNKILWSVGNHIPSGTKRAIELNFP